MSIGTNGAGSWSLWGGAQGGCFDVATLAGFRAYLSDKFPAATLKGRFDISDPSSFDYRTWIVKHGTEKTWNQMPLAGLAAEFYWFQSSAEGAFGQEMAAFARQYALQSRGRTVILAGGGADEGPDSPSGNQPGDLIGASEQFLFSFTNKPASPFANVFIKEYKGIRQWPVVVESEPMLLDPAHTRLPKSTVNMIRLSLADIYASGGTIALPGEFLKWSSDRTRWIAYDPAVMKRYAQFILGNPALFENLRTPAQVAILNSTASRWAFNFDIVATPGLTLSRLGDPQYKGMGRLLIDANVQWESPLAPETGPSFTLAQLQKYKVLVLPDVLKMDDGQANTILDYVRSGGVVVATGLVGTHQFDGQLATRPDLLKLQSVEGVTPYGSGLFVHTSKEVGWLYQKAFNAGDDQAKSAIRESFEALISPYITPDVVTSPVSHVYRSGGATAFLYRDPSDAFILHLVNYDFDPFTDRYAPKDNVQVTLQVGSQPVDEVILRSPDMSAPQALPFSRSGDTITFTIPHLEAWDVLSLQQNSAAPVIQSAVPAANIGAAGGATLNFSVQVSDANSNPLNYTWTVNGQVVTDGYGPQFAYRVPQSASGGTCTVTVTVTDGSRTTKTSWTVTVPGFRSPRVLFDESHDEMVTLDAIKGSLVDPTNPPWTLYNYSDLAKWPNAASFTFTRFTTGPITASALSAVDTLILASPRQAFTSAEVQAISTFVRNGGGLVFLGDRGLGHGGKPTCNDMIATFGLQLDDRAILSTESVYSAGTVDVVSWVNHPAFDRVLDFQNTPQPALQMVFGGSFSVSPPAVALGSTSDATWRGTSSADAVSSPGAGLGPFTIVAASLLGSGRVFAISTTWVLRPVNPLTPPSQNVFLSGLAWASGNANPPATVTPSTPPKFSQASNGASYTPTISPGSWVAIFGESLASTGVEGRTWSSSDFRGNQLPVSLAGTSVLINGRPAAISFVSPTQLNVQAPDDITEGQVTVEVSTSLGVARGTASLAMLAPAAFQLPGKGLTYAAAVSMAGVLIAHVSDYPGARAAQPGETISVFGTGFGPSSPLQPAGQLVQAAPLAGSVTATVCGIPAEVSWAGVAGPGLDQINLTVPSTGATGDCSVRFSIGGKLTPTGVSIPVQ